jgi:hypothetical protein
MQKLPKRKKIQPPILFIIFKISSADQLSSSFFREKNDLEYSSSTNGYLYRFNPIITDQLELVQEQTINKFITALFHANTFDFQRINYIHINNVEILQPINLNHQRFYVNLVNASNPISNRWITSILSCAPKFQKLPII